MPPRRAQEPSIWLCLSGGGLRAAIFHYGCLKRLKELGILPHIAAISATSGGAIVAALLHLYADLEYADKAQGKMRLVYDWDAFERAFLSMAKRGLFGPTYLLLSAYGSYIVGLIGVLANTSRLERLLSLVLVGLGVMLHVRLAVLLLREGAHRATRQAMRKRATNARLVLRWASDSRTRYLRMLFVPSYLREQTFNLRGYHGLTLCTLSPVPGLFLTAVELNTGREMVFSPNVVANLDAPGCRYLWEQRADGEQQYAVNRLEVAEAVAASSAFPPVFRPVRVRDIRDDFGVFVDGGVLDNFALAVPKAMAVHIHRDRPRYADGGAFRDRISLLLAMDGGKGPKQKARTSWGRLRAGKRLLDILVDQQFEAAGIEALNFARNTNIPTQIVGLQPGFPPDHPLFESGLDDALRGVRTHLDAFSLEEIATIAYCGYSWIDSLATGKGFSGYEGTSYPPRKAFTEILPEYAGRWNSSVEHLQRHLAFSDTMIGGMRGVYRRTASVFAVLRGKARSGAAQEP